MFRLPSGNLTSSVVLLLRFVYEFFFFSCSLICFHFSGIFFHLRQFVMSVSSSV